jgi:hypothetical protein
MGLSMRFRTNSWLPAKLLLLAIASWLAINGGCDTGPTRDPDDAGPGTDNNTGQDESPPVLIRVEGAEDPLCAGDVIRIIGLNFSSALSENQVEFTAGGRRVSGLVLSLRQEPSSNGIDVQSQLEVVVPGGVSRGNVELIVSGRSAGATGFDACPTLAGFTLGNNGDQPFLEFTPLGFRDGASRITVFGLTLADVQDLLLVDDLGNERIISSSTFIRNPGGTQAGVEPSGYDSIAVNLRDTENDIRLPFSGDQSNLNIRLGGVASSSRLPPIENGLAVPITTDPGVANIFFIISSMKVPSGVVSGPVMIEYTAYEMVVDAHWRMNVEFRAVNEQNTASQWFTAKPLPADQKPSHNGTQAIVAGSIAHRSGERLLPGNGDVRTFVWDAPNDPAFRLLNEQVTANGLDRPRYWRVEFRLSPIPDTENRDETGHQAITPPIVYFDVVDRPSGSAAPLRVGQLLEEFNDNVLEDRLETTAEWGPPVIPGFAQGGTDDDGSSVFGEGTAVVVLENVDPLEFVDPGETIVNEFIEFNTDRREIVHHVVTDNASADPLDDVDNAFLEVLLDASGNVVGNPGSSDGEFHFSTLTVAPGVRLFGTGERPLVIRLSGRQGGTDDEIVFDLQALDGALSTIDVSGGPGGVGSTGCPTPPNCGGRAGRGGRAGPGGGLGGDGGILLVDTGTNRGQVSVYTAAGDGGNHGGTGGASPGAISFVSDPAVRSLIHGAPGGGGGHRLPGADGDYGRANVPQYQTPAVGRGGPVRGSIEQFPETAGSGGGGGGATLVRQQEGDGGPFFTAAGGAGGGGGGLFVVHGRGRARIEGSILATGGAGGDSVSPAIGAPPDYPRQMTSGGGGGGGSGGSIVVRMTGPIDLADCASLIVDGGAGAKVARAGNQQAGNGAPGYVRLESGSGVLPNCAGLPIDPGTVIGGGVLPGDIGEFGRGQDGVLHLTFRASIDPVTGSPITDATTGRIVSIWTYDTDKGLFTNPSGGTLRTRQPGLIDLTRLRIDEDVILRVSGSKALEFIVRDVAEILGTIDASGFDGGPLRFSAPGTIPLSGVGGAGGPGGGPGGNGGGIEYLDGNVDNLASTNTIPVQGSEGGSPPILAIWNVDNPLGDSAAADEILPPQFFTASGGASLPGRGADVPGGCDGECLSRIDAESAGGGAGGGHRAAGTDGQARLLVADPDRLELLIGHAGSALGFDTLRFNGDLFLPGGSGGSGGGASANVSTAYKDRAIAGRFPFAGVAKLAPGTGGGGGGGSVVIRAAHIIIGKSARILARGGNAFQSIDLGGNGGAGAGGSILVQVARSLNVSPGAVVDVSGGKANLLPPRTSEGRLAYEGNMRSSFRDSAPSDQGEIFGGRGGDGAAGRVRFEAPEGSSFFATGANANVSTGLFLADVIETVAVSLPVELGIGPGASARSIVLDIDAPRVVFSPIQPPGTLAKVLWQGARESRDIHAAVSAFSAPVDDPRLLQDYEFVRFLIHFRSNVLTRSSQAVQSVQLRYEFDPAGE